MAQPVRRTSCGIVLCLPSVAANPPRAGGNSPMANGREPETRLAAWRDDARQAAAVPGAELDERERTLSTAFHKLREAGFDPDEAFLVALKRVGEQHPQTRESCPATRDPDDGVARRGENRPVRPRPRDLGRPGAGRARRRRQGRPEPGPARESGRVGLVPSAVPSRAGQFAALERWQTGFLPVYAGWATVTARFPPLFGYV